MFIGRTNAESETSKLLYPTSLHNQSKLFFCFILYSVPWIITISSVHSLSSVLLFATPWTAARQTSLPITNSRSLSSELMMPSNSPILCHPFSSCLQSFPVLGYFPMSQFFTSGGQSIGVSASASVFPMNFQD